MNQKRQESLSLLGNINDQFSRRGCLCGFSYTADVLLDQSIFSEVGNIIKNEVLFLVKKKPSTVIKTKLHSILVVCLLLMQPLIHGYSAENCTKQDDGSVLIDFFENHEHRLIHKWMHYFEIYERHLSKFRGQELAVIEFGVFHGGSLQMWKYYFGADAKVFGFDINPQCKNLEEENITILIGDQENRNSFRQITDIQPQFDIVIDDGGHTMRQQRITFEEMWGCLKDGGIYICEDLHTSYWPEYGGGYKKQTSFVEYTKNLIDMLNAWHSPDPNLQVNDFTRSAFSIHYYDSVVVIEKRRISRPYALMRGTPSF